MEWKEIHAALEGLLFAAGEAVPMERLCEALEADRETVEKACLELGDEYRFGLRGIRLLRLDDSVQMASAPACAEAVRRLQAKKKPDRLSQAALEVLSIVAYYQPTTRAYIDQVRGVDSAYSVGLLQDRELIETCGQLDAPGKPFLYRTTRNFLRAFGLTSLEELPPLTEVRAAEKEGN